MDNRTIDEVRNNETKLINRQKEFIEYLEDKIKIFKISKKSFTSTIVQYNADLLIEKYQEILSKYKEIIGGKE